MKRALPFALAALAPFATTASAQTILDRLDEVDETIFAKVSPLGDVDGDGVGDILTGWGEPVLGDGMMARPVTRVYSGATRALLHEFIGEPGEGPAYIRDAGDFNGDGRAEILIGTPYPNGVLHGAGRLQVYSGGDFSLLAEFFGEAGHERLGVASAGHEDIDLDGVPDLVVGGTNFGPDGVLRAYSGATFQLLFEKVGGMSFGWDVEVHEDWNNDGIPDIAVGAPMWGDAKGALYIVSGTDGEVLDSFHASELEYLGYSVRSIDDVDGDGRAELLVGSVRSKVLSGADLSVLAAFPEAESPSWPSTADSAGDVDGDGFEDAVITSTAPGSAQVAVFSVVDGAKLYDLSIPATSPYELWSCAGLGDLNADGFPEIGASFYWTAEGGDPVFVVSPCPLPTRSFCETSPNSTGAGALLQSDGSTSLAANDLSIVASGLPPGQPGRFFFGYEEATMPLGDGTLCVGGPTVRFPVGVSDAAGDLVQVVDNAQLPQGAAWAAGTTVRIQAWYRDPASGAGAFNLSDGLAATLCP